MYTCVHDVNCSLLCFMAFSPKGQEFTCSPRKDTTRADPGGVMWVTCYPPPPNFNDIHNTMLLASQCVCINLSQSWDCKAI